MTLREFIQDFVVGLAIGLAIIALVWFAFEYGV